MVRRPDQHHHASDCNTSSERNNLLTYREKAETGKGRPLEGKSLKLYSVGTNKQEMYIPVPSVRAASFLSKKFSSRELDRPLLTAPSATWESTHTSTRVRCRALVLVACSTYANRARNSLTLICWSLSHFTLTTTLASS